MVGRAGSVSSSTSKVKKGTGATIPTGSGFFALSWYPNNPKPKTKRVQQFSLRITILPMPYQPPFHLTPLIVNTLSTISRHLGRFDRHRFNHSPQLRKQNRIRTLHSTLAIEGNSLTPAQITAIIDGKRVLGQPREIQEVQNAIQTYERLPHWDPTNLNHLLQAHQSLMAGPVSEAGKFRKMGVGIYREHRAECTLDMDPVCPPPRQSSRQIVHVPPPAQRVSLLMADLLDWLKMSQDHPLIKSSVFHYELEFIHPFIDGNGRMGRLWQTAILGRWDEIFYVMPIESLIKDNQDQYYRSLEIADRSGDSTGFIEFILEMINNVLEQQILTLNQETDPVPDPPTDPVSYSLSSQVQKLLAIMDDRDWSVSQLMIALNLSHRPNFRRNYLNPALKLGLITPRYPDQPHHPQQRYYRKLGINLS